MQLINKYQPTFYNLVILHYFLTPIDMIRTTYLTVNYNIYFIKNGLNEISVIIVM